MKKIFLSLMAMCAVAGANAQNVFSVENAAVAPGSSAKVSVNLANTDATIDMFQINIDENVPEGLTIETEAGTWNFAADRYEGPASNFSFKKNKRQKAYVAALTNISEDKYYITGNDGEIFNFTVTADAGMAEGEVTLNVTKVVVLDGTNELTASFDAIKINVTTDTGIESVSVENNAPVYNLAGMLMNGNLQKGIYVQNGKKYIVK